eukprot:UN25747
MMILRHLVDDCMYEIQLTYLVRLRVYESVKIHDSWQKILPGVWLAIFRLTLRFLECVLRLHSLRLKQFATKTRFT